MNLEQDVYGECIYQDPYVFVSIPKNASTWMRNLLVNAPSTNIDNLHKNYYRNKQHVCILRDPIDRWISGASELLYARNNIGQKIEHFVEFACKHICLDQHTDLQINFLDNVPLHQTVWYYFDRKRLEKKFHKWASRNNVKLNTVMNNYKNYSNDERLWFSPGDPFIREVSKTSAELLPGFSRKEISGALRAKLENNHVVVRRIQEFYQLDYELITNCKFQ